MSKNDVSKEDVLTEDELKTYDKVKEYLESQNWNISEYHTVFLSLMITLRKSYEEVATTKADIPKMPQLATETMDLMPVMYSNHQVLKTSWKRSLKMLEDDIDASNMPIEYLSSKRRDGDMETVSNCVKRIGREAFGEE